MNCFKSFFEQNKTNNEIAVCIGSGRFLRSVLVPIFLSRKIDVIIAQTRGNTFVTSCIEQNGKYQVETVQRDGTIERETFQILATGTLGDENDKKAFFMLPKEYSNIRYIGIGVTEEGIALDSLPMIYLSEFLYQIYLNHSENKISIINTDNVPLNGNIIKEYIFEGSYLKEKIKNKSNSNDTKFKSIIEYINDNVVFHNTMVDRIVSFNEINTVIPKAEPQPYKALVIEDLNHFLPENFIINSNLSKESNNKNNIIIRRKEKEIEKDYLLKLCIANGIHTSIVYLLSLLKIDNTKYLKDYPIIMKYIDHLYKKDILPGLLALKDYTFEQEEIDNVYKDWIERLLHPYFGMNSFFVCQNAIKKYEIRVFSNILNNINNNIYYEPSMAMVFSIALLLRYLTPFHLNIKETSRGKIYEGKTFINGYDSSNSKIIEYTNDLVYNLGLNYYTFRENTKNIPEILYNLIIYNYNKMDKNTSISYISSCIMGILSNNIQEFDTNNICLIKFTTNVSILYEKLISLSFNNEKTTTSVLDILSNDIITYNGTELYLNNKNNNHLIDQNIYFSISNDTFDTKKDNLKSLYHYIKEEINKTPIIDVHTHLFPVSHNDFNDKKSLNLMLYGIDDLLTYHYLISELFITTTIVTIEEFNNLEKTEKANIIWKELFINRTPGSEACKGVLTTLFTLSKFAGLPLIAIQERDLLSIRKWFDQFNPTSLKQNEISTKSAIFSGPDGYVDLLFRISNIKYIVMTNIPFVKEEAIQWIKNYKINKPQDNRFKSALRVDQLLTGSWSQICNAMDAFHIMNNSSNENKFEHTYDGCKKYLIKWIEIMKPEYFMVSMPTDFGETIDLPVNHSKKEIYDGLHLLNYVLIPLAFEYNLPIAFKFDSIRPINDLLGIAGDGLCISNGPSLLRQLCVKYPKIKFLATFLSRVNQHEVTIIANKFNNLHLYGCWWYCNNPSIVKEITKMRLEILGIGGFTSQHSDARVYDQLIYKWIHFKDILSNILYKIYKNIIKTGWKISKNEIKRDIKRLLGGSYEEFMAKKL